MAGRRREGARLAGDENGHTPYGLSDNLSELFAGPVKVQGCQTLLGDCLLNVWKMAAKDLIGVDKQAIINLETGIFEAHVVAKSYRRVLRDREASKRYWLIQLFKC